MNQSLNPTPFRLTGTLNTIPNKRLSQGMEKLLEKAFSLQHLERLYQQLPPSRDDKEFLQKVFDTFNINYQVAQEELDHIPKTGPMVIVANHPFGCIEGVIMAAILRQIRPDVKIMANFILKRIPEIRDLFIPVNPFGGRQATQNNITPLKEAIRWLKQDGLLVVFPAGEVSHFNPIKRQVVDPKWSPTIGRLIHLTKAPVQSAYFHGANSVLFQMAGMLHPLLRTAMLPRELINKTNTTIPIRFSQVMPYNKLKNINDDEKLIDYLRLRTYMLRNDSPKRALPSSNATNQTKLQDVIPPIDAELMLKEVNRLPKQQHLVDSGEMQVYFAHARQTPNLLREIGRLREIVFRATGEGTGKEIDLDNYDNYYLHLFIWNKVKNEVVGAYRLGLGDEIMANYGKQGFYSYSLFKYSKQLINRINPAIELGRSFVRSEYQKSFAPLMLLWKGIGAFVARNPRYNIVFGPVSISNDYQSTSQQLMVDFLQANNRQAQLAKQVKPRSPFKANTLSGIDNIHTRLDNIDHISDLVSEIERDKKGIPILIKQYLKLGGDILAFNVDDQFNDALDGLIMVDLLKTEAKTLAKYMGKEELHHFRAYHQSSQQEYA